MANEVRHIIKKYIQQDDGIDRGGHAWCGKRLLASYWYFQSMQHATLTVLNGSAITPCKKCMKAAKNALEEALRKI